MALRTCWRIASVAPRVLWRSAVFSDACSARGQSWLSFVNNHTGSTSTRLTVCKFSSTTQPITDVSYEELKQIVGGQKALIIDVREPWELREYGSIPGSINVPLGQINIALQLDAEEFEEKFGGQMPQQTDSIVFMCLAGVRSKTALNAATSLGYKSVQHYPGGWQEWAANEQK